MRFLFLMVGLAFAACQSTSLIGGGVKKIGQNKFMVTARSDEVGARDLAQNLAIKTADQFCFEQGKEADRLDGGMTSSLEHDPISDTVDTDYTYEHVFQCLDPHAPEAPPQAPTSAAEPKPAAEPAPAIVSDPPR